MHSPRPLTRRRRAALMNGEAAEEGDAGKAEPSAGPSNKRDTEARTRCHSFGQPPLIPGTDSADSACQFTESSSACNTPSMGTK